ncbi:MAG: isocitrate lyase/phosphoenolpyruvate mutase family protein, partial [Terriglobia bacterium]
GLEPALERAERYAEAGADMLFIEALRSVEDMKAANARFKGKAPLMANMVEGGKTPVLSAAELEAVGYSFAIFPGGTVRSVAFSLAEYFSILQKEGSTANASNRMLDFNGLNETIGTPELLQLGKKYDA